MLETVGEIVGIAMKRTLWDALLRLFYAICGLCSVASLICRLNGLDILPLDALRLSLDWLDVPSNFCNMVALWCTPHRTLLIVVALVVALVSIYEVVTLSLPDFVGLELLKAIEVPPILLALALMLQVRCPLNWIILSSLSIWIYSVFFVSANQNMNAIAAIFVASFTHIHLWLGSLLLSLFYPVMFLIGLMFDRLHVRDGAA